MSIMSKYKTDIMDMFMRSTPFPNTTDLQLNALIGLFLQKEMYELGKITKDDYEQVISLSWDQWPKTSIRMTGGQQ